MSAIDRHDVWAVGSSSTGRTLTERWDGSAWTVVPSPDPSDVRNSLSGVEAIVGGIVWAVGGQAPTGGGQDRTFVIQTTQG